MIPFTLVALAVLFPQQGATAPAAKPSLLPAPKAEAPSSDLLNWRGWGYLKGVAGTESSLYGTPGDWSALNSLKPVPDGTPQWRVKVIVFRNLVRGGRDSLGLLRTDRETIEDGQIAEVRRAVQRLSLHLQAASHDHVRPIVDIVEEDEAMFADFSAASLGADFARPYLATRINGGGYEAEDKVYRGPYSSVICLLPGAVASQPLNGEIYGIPYSVLSIEDALQAAVPGSLDSRLWDSTRQHLTAQAKLRGFAGLQFSSSPSADAWSSIGITNSFTAADRVSRAQAQTALVLDTAIGEGLAYGSTWRAPSSEAEVVTDVDKGQVVKVTMKGSTRGFGIALPKRSDGVASAFLEDGRTLNISLKTVAKDPFALRLEGKDGQRMWVAFGHEVSFPGDPVLPIAVSPVVTNGTWQNLTIDIGGIAEQAGIKEVTGLTIEFTPRSRRLSKTASEPVELFVSDIHFGKEPITATPDDTTEAEKRALAAIASTKSNPDLIAALGDRNSLVRLNAADAYTRIKDLEAEPILGNLAIGIDAAIAERALQALAFQGTDTAMAMIRRSVRSSLNDQNKAAASLLLGATKDARYNGDLATLLAARSWRTRLTAVKALTLMGSREAAIIRLAFIAQENPDIKLAVTENVDAKDEPQLRRLLWSAVNEPSDLVRATSALKLIESPLDALRKEGYKSVRDDSPTVRRLILEALAAKPNELHRTAIRLGIADSNSIVRAAAVRAFAALEAGATPEELAPAMEDASPEVSLALIDYVKVKKLDLAASTLKRLRESPFADVREAVKALGGAS